jgi:phospholipase C
VKKLAAVVALIVASLVAGGSHGKPARASTPIQHVIVLYQENHSFDNVLGNWCASTGHCIGMPPKVTLKTPKGKRVVVTPVQAPDQVPVIGHSVAAQTTAIDGGKMDGWAQLLGCSAKKSYACVDYYTPAQIPNLITLASSFAISEGTFSEADSPSWGGHLYAVAASTGGFTGDNPTCTTTVQCGPGWGCDSNQISAWRNPVSGTLQQEPSCIPDPALPNPNGGAFAPTPVPNIPTIMDRLDAASLPWKIYTTPTPDTNLVPPAQASYKWATCPSFAECLDTAQRQKMVPTDTILDDAANGRLPAFGLVLPSPWSDPVSGGASQHNGTSMAVGDNWIGKLTSALESSSEWSSTALFITYDDCGCFYDQVVPGTNPDGTPQGIRVPLVIVSPYAIAGYVDNTRTTFAGILKFVEQTFGLPALSLNDKNAYAFANAFNYAQVPIAPVRMVEQPLTATQRLDGAAVGEDPT